MSARNKHKPASAKPQPRLSEVDRCRAAMVFLLMDATTFVAASRVEEIMRDLLPQSRTDQRDEDPALILAQAMAMDLALFAKSASGQTAFDRLAKRRRDLDADARLALELVRRATFRLLRIETAAGAARDLTTGEAMQVATEEFKPGLVGFAVVGRVGFQADGRAVFVTGLTPLDDAGLAMALGLVRPGASGPLPARAAELIYRYVLRHGRADILGLNHGSIDDFELDGSSELDAIAERWTAPGIRDAEDIQLVRGESDLDSILDMITSALCAGTGGLASLADAYAEIVGLQLETVQLRHAAGSGSLSLDHVRAAVEAEIADGMPPQAREVFNQARRRLGPTQAEGRQDAELDRLIARIQALRAKTVEQGCTEAEALAAAGKVAELLDRYGLSLSELDIKRQTCEGAAIETSRKRAGPVDDCVPAIAAFFDCRAWGEKAADGTLRHVFFGMPADVMAARYLFDLVDMAFTTETALFRAGPTYAALPAGLRRTATNSFGLGFSRGISAKLHTLRSTRQNAMRGAGGRDLVVAKAQVVDRELERLGLRLRRRTVGAGRRVLSDAFQEGHQAGLDFEYVPGIAGGV